MHANKHKTYLCRHIHWQGVELSVAAFEQVVLHAYTTKRSHKPLRNMQQTLNIFTIEHVYRYATLSLGVPVCLGGVRIDT